MHPHILIRRKKGQARGVGIMLQELCESSKFSANARLELMKWFPSSPWVRTLHEQPLLREQILEGRRNFLFGAAGATVALSLPACVAAGPLAALLFKLIDVALNAYSAGQGSGGSAFFENGTGGREKFQLLTQLVQGKKPSAYDDPDNYHDELEFALDVPPTDKEKTWAYPYEGLITENAGDYFVAGTAVGETLFTDIFKYV